MAPLGTDCDRQHGGHRARRHRHRQRQRHRQRHRQWHRQRRRRHRRRPGPDVAAPAGPRGPGGRRNRTGGAGSGRSQTRPSFSRAVQQVSVIRRVTTYGSTFAFGRRSSM
ncbi:hypothetical protein DRB89_39470 [Streptomyces sp. ICC4]|nr:hypothetical protein DRB89_39470 [Streptomyces sp. ICC4]